MVKQKNKKVCDHETMLSLRRFRGLKKMDQLKQEIPNALTEREVTRTPFLLTFPI